MLETLSKLGIEENFNLIKTIYKNPTDSILNVVTLKISSWGQNQSKYICSHYFHSLLYSSVISKEKEIKGIKVGKQESKLLLFITDVVLYF